MSQRRKGACTIAALAVGFGCAVFGVGGADGGTRAYARHVREARLEARLAGLALDRRSPEQLVLAIRPKTNAAHSAAASTAVTQAPITTSAATTSTTPAATTSTTPAATTSTTPSTSTSSTPSAAEGAGESVAPSNPVSTVTTTTGSTTTGTTTTGTTTTGTTTTGTTTTGTTTTGTTTTGTTTTGTTTTGTTTTGTTTTGTTTTGTTTTGTTTTGTTTTGTTTTGTTTTGTATNASTTVNGRDPSGATTSTITGCHGRCEGLTGSSGAVPATLPSTTSSSTSNNFSFTETSVPAVTPATSAASSAVNDASSSTLNPTATTTTPATSSSPSSGTSTSTGSSNQLSSIITQLEHKLPATSSIGSLTHSSGSHRSGATLPTTASGTGTVPAGGGTGTGPAGGAGTVAAAGTTAATRRSALTHRAGRHPSSGGSTFTAPFNSSVQVIDHIVNVIPTGVWVALGAAFTLMLAFAGVALRSSRRARRREKEFAAISAAALTDALTGILNRRGFTEAAERELARASRYERPFVLAYVDVRGLKAVNDTEGHLMGDELIKAVAGLMKESARADDVVGRIGGDEFALLLGEQTAESAEPVIRRIRARVAEARAEMEISVPWELTIGVASFPGDGATLDELLDLADRRLYEQRGIALR
jgi:diguanylate cyclase (GGDEF)-like protein